MKSRKTSLTLSILFWMIVAIGVSPGAASRAQVVRGASPPQPDSPTAPGDVFIPVLFGGKTPTQKVDGVRMNAPFFDGDVVYEQMAIAWLGKISSIDNYADIRVGYNKELLYIDLAVFDRRLWYDESPSRTTLTEWDAASLYLDLNGNTGSVPASTSYRFDLQLSHWQPPSNYQAAFRGNGSGWVDSSTYFATETAWRGDGLNNNTETRGWVARFYLSYGGLGLSAPPAPGTVWGMSLVLHDRDDQDGTKIPLKTWPAPVNTREPSTWGQLHFGLPVYEAPPSTGGGTTLIRHGESGQTVLDVDIGGSINNQCGEHTDFWEEWGNTNYGGADSILIQNQSDVADWPCFSKYFVTFPLGLVPQGKVIRSAKLVLHVWGGSDPSRAQPSYLQVLEIPRNWNESELTWNNAPPALQNIAGTWVYPYTTNPIEWPGGRYEWEVSVAAARAYAEGNPLRLAVYSADSYYHSGKYFSASETEDWDKEGRPSLIIEWGNP